MNVEELKADEALVKAIKKFVSTPDFLEIKDAFVSHTPEAAANETNVSFNFGKLIGTRYVFNEFERIAKTTPKLPKAEKTGEGDPDLKV
jgi:hypothetical protein